MIKTALIAAGALALSAGMALAQDPPGKLAPTSSPQGDTTVTASSRMPQTMPATAPTMIANMPAGDAPSSYPPCTHKGQDRCMQRHIRP